MHETRQSIVRRAAGNPLFVEQLVRHLEEQVERDGAAGSSAAEVRDDSALKESVTQALPESLQTLIAARLDELPAPDKALLGDAAVVGQVFWTGAVAALDHGDREAAEEGLADLARRELVRHERDSSLSGESEFAFSHGLIRDVAYGQLTRTDRAAKHAAVARWLEATVGDRADEVAEIRANHYAVAFDLAQAAHEEALAEELREPTVRALKLAGDRAMALDVTAAEAHYARAFALAGDSPQRPYVQVAWAQALLWSGRLEEAAGALDEGVSGLRALGDERAARVAATRRWEAHSLLADGEITGGEAADLADSDERAPERVTLLKEAADRAVHVGQATLANELIDRAVALSRELHLPESSGVICIRGMARCALGEAAGLDDLTYALDLARARGIAHAQCSLLSNLGEFLALFEGPQAALQVELEGPGLARRHHDELALCFTRAVVFVSRLWAGHWNEALAEVDDLDPFLEEHNDLWDLQVVRSTTGLLRAWRGDAEGAQEPSVWAEERSRAASLPAIRAACLISLASVRAALGDTAAALELLSECRTLSSAACVPDLALRMPEAIRLAVGLGEPRLAQDLTGGLPATRPYDAATLVALEALLGEQSGNVGDAAARFAEAEDRWAGLGVPYERAQATLGKGRCLAALGKTPDARTALGSAHEVLLTLGAQPALAEVATLLEALAD